MLAFGVLDPAEWAVFGGFAFVWAALLGIGIFWPYVEWCREQDDSMTTVSISMTFVVTLAPGENAGTIINLVTDAATAAVPLIKTSVQGVTQVQNP